MHSSTRKTPQRRTIPINNNSLKANNSSQQERLSCNFFDDVFSNINKLWLLLCYLRVPFHQLASPTGLHVTHIPKRNSEYVYIYGKGSCGESTTWEPPSIWSRVWHCPNCCRIRSIHWYFINHHLPETSLRTYYSRLLIINQDIKLSWLFKVSFRAKEGRHHFLGWLQ